MKITSNYWFFGSSKAQLKASKGKTWSGGTNSRLLFAVNVTLNPFTARVLGGVL